MNRSLRAYRRWASIALLGVMCLGSAFHFLHHLTDRDCDASGRHGSVPCTSCSVLHGGAITPQTDVSAPRVPSVIARLSIPDADQPTTRSSVEGTPRAPPTA
jgi:hypothetical protein